VTAPPRLHVERDGEGPTVVLAHGLGGSARNFTPQARALRDRWAVVRYDARGHARSEAPADAAAYTAEALADDMGRVLDEVGTRSAVVGGLSLGAATALRFACAHPDRVRALVLAAFPPSADAAGGFARVATAFAEAIERDGLEAAGATFVWGPQSGLDPQAAALVRRGFLEHPAPALAALLRGVIAVQPAVETLAPQLAALRIPALIVVGARDRGSRAPCRALAAALPAARLVEIPDAGHVVNLQQPRAFNAALREFLEGAAGV
jgi:pimeloyl-ACP methyl ester carboxylesterase